MMHLKVERFWQNNDDRTRELRMITLEIDGHLLDWHVDVNGDDTD